MLKLIPFELFKIFPFELFKIWRKRSFLIFICGLLCLNIFMLWYTTLPEEGEPPLSSYKAVSGDLSTMNEKEKYNYITELKERIDGVSTLSEILSMQARGDEMDAALAEQMLMENQGIAEQYMQVYQSGEYLEYTDNLHKEKVLIDDLYAEMITVSGYDEYLDGIQSSAESLGGISVFGAVSDNDFSRQNIEKSVIAHDGLSSGNIRFFPSKGIRIALESPVTDLLLVLAVFLFIGSLITEEKEKGLFYITRATKNGVAACIGAKLFALIIHVLAVCFLFYGSNFLYAGFTTGLCDFSAQLQSISVYLVSSLSVTLFGYALLSLFTKVLVLFCLGVALTAVSICTEKSYLPQLAGIGWLGANWIFYTVIPAYSDLNIIKYLSFFGIMKTEHLYGGYLNLNIARHAVSRMSLSVLVISGLCAIGVLVSFFLFCKGKSLEIRKAYHVPVVPFHPHGSLWWHEAYKILFTNKALIILLVFALLIGYRDLGKTYSPSVSEQYYASIMRELEGRLTKEKEQLVLAEQARFDEARNQIERIEERYADGTLDKSTAEQMKIQWYGVLAFYPAFERVETQYENIRSEGGEFIYDTGYQYLFGTLDDSFITDLLLLSLCMIFGFGNVMAMEEQKHSWYLLAATAKGKHQIICKKLAVCGAVTGVMTLLAWIFRFLSISRAYPMQEVFAKVNNLPMYFNWNIGLPIWAFIGLAVISQIVAVCLVSAAILLLSYKRKNYLGASIIALLVFAVPLILSIMGMDFVKWFSVYPIYSWMSFV